MCEERRGSARRMVTEDVLRELDRLLETTTQALGYLRRRWSSELLAKELRARTGVRIHPSTVRRALGQRVWVWRRVRPTLYIADPGKKQRMRAIRHALVSQEPGVEVFYQDEADIELNPRIGSAWRRRGRANQETVPTPGKNRKAYVAGALNAHTGKVVCVGAVRKNSELFIEMLDTLEYAYPKGKQLVLILDNYGVHKSRAVNRWLEQHPKFPLATARMIEPLIIIKVTPRS